MRPIQPAKRRGSTLVELALSLPILLLFLSGIIDMGWMFSRDLILVNAAREGARLGTLGKTDVQVRTAVKTYLQNAGYSPLPSDGDIAVDLAGGMSKVTLTSAVPLWMGTGGPSVTLKSSTVMRIE